CSASISTLRIPKCVETSSTALPAATIWTSAEYKSGESGDHRFGEPTSSVCSACRVSLAGKRSWLSVVLTVAPLASNTRARTTTSASAWVALRTSLAIFTTAFSLDTSGVVTKTPQAGTQSGAVTVSQV